MNPGNSASSRLADRVVAWARLPRATAGFAVWWYL